MWLENIKYCSINVHWIRFWCYKIVLPQEKSFIFNQKTWYVAQIFIVLICNFMPKMMYYTSFQMCNTASIRRAVLTAAARRGKLDLVRLKIPPLTLRSPLWKDLSSVHCQLYLPARFVCFPCLSLHWSPHLVWTLVPSSCALSEPLMSCSPYAFRPSHPLRSCWPPQQSHCNIQQKRLFLFYSIPQGRVSACVCLQLCVSRESCMIEVYGWVILFE